MYILMLLCTPYCACTLAVVQLIILCLIWNHVEFFYVSTSEVCDRTFLQAQSCTRRILLGRVAVGYEDLSRT